MKSGNDKHKIITSGKILIFLLISVFSIGLFSSTSIKSSTETISVIDHIEIDGVFVEDVDADMVLSSRTVKVTKKLVFLEHFFSQFAEIFEAKKEQNIFYKVETVRCAIRSFLHLLTLY